MNITITEELINSIIVESKNNGVLEVIKEDDESNKDIVEEVKKNIIWLLI